MENNYMDKLVRDAIGDYEPNFPDSDWDEMESLIENDNSMRRKMYIAKGIEVLLMVFAIWTVIQFVNTDTASNAQDANVPTTTQPSEQQNAPAIIIDDNNEEQKVEPTDKLENGNSEEPQATDKEQIFAKYEQGQLQNDIQTVENSFDNDKINLPIAKNIHENINNEGVVIHKNTDNAELLSRPIASTISMDALESIEQGLLQNNARSLSPLPTFFKETDASRMTKPRKWKLGAFASLDFFKIQPDETVNPNVSKQAQNFNPGVGLVADYVLTDDLELEFGAAFACKEHVIRTNTQTSTGIIAELQGIHTYTIEVPVALKYNIVNKGNTKLYVMGGASNYFITNVKNTALEYQTYNSTMTPSPNRQPVMDLGLLEQGELPSNHYISLNGGIGVEHSLPRKNKKAITIFAQANYKQGLLRTGRHNDQISALALQVGAKSEL